MHGSSNDDQQISRVADFYDGKSVFITGTAGFIGSILLEALLRCFPGIQYIYILLRSKKNVSPETRREKIFSKKIFERLKVENRQMLDKVRVIEGDVSLPNLGMREEDVYLLSEEISIVFHCAAVTNFKKPLRFILLNNVLSVNSVIELCRKMRKFEALVYTSTAFSNCNHINYTIKEKVYRLPFPAEDFLSALINEENEKLLELFGHCKPDWPNTYNFSKCLAENVILDTASDLPVAIVRPSIVISTCKQPLPGYLEEQSGMAALLLGAGKGVVRVIHGDPNIKLNMVPADMVINTHLLAAWSLGTNRCVSPLVVNCTATDNFHITFSEYNEVESQLAHKYPIPKSFRTHKKMIVISNRYLYSIAAAYHHYLPAVVLDGILKVIGKKTRLFSLYRFIDAIISSLNHFMFHTFEFERDNLEYLDKLTHPEDKKVLSLDFRDATVLEMAYKLPEAAPFYDWIIDDKTQVERQKIKYRIHILIYFIQGIFLTTIFAFIYFICSLLYHYFMTSN